MWNILFLVENAYSAKKQCKKLLFVTNLNLKDEKKGIDSKCIYLSNEQK